MTQPSDKGWKKNLLIAGVLVLVGGSIAWNNASPRFWQWFQPIFNEVDAWLTLASTTLLVGGLLFAVGRSSRLLALFLISAILNTGLGIYLNHGGDSLPVWLLYALSGIAGITNFGVVVPVGILLTFRFKGNLDRLRVCAIFATVAVPVMRLVGWWMVSDLWNVLFLVGSTLTSLLLIVAAWCLAFYRVPARHRPPADAGRAVSLDCPRCAAEIEIPAGHGECPHCRLQITISLEEGVCAKCQYPLRGLKGEACPECGERIVRAGNVEEGAAIVTREG